MNLSKLIEILAQYLQTYGDIEIMYSDSDETILEEITEIDLNIRDLSGKKILSLDTILVEN
jgi:hypothetical protein